MRNLILALVALFILAGCQQPTTSTPVNMVHKVVKNSLWQDVTPTITKSLGRSMARELTGADLEAYLANYNAVTLDDYLRLYDSDAVPSVENAPLASVYFCNPATNEINSKWEGIPRMELITNIAAWRAAAYGQTIYIDHVPPVVVPPPPPNPYAYWAIYEIDDVGGIQFETHSGYLPDGTFDGEWIYQGGWSGPQQYFEQLLRAANLDVQGKPGWYVLSRVLYTPPMVP